MQTPTLNSFGAPFSIPTLLLKLTFLLTPFLLMAQPAYDLQIAKPVVNPPYKIWQKDQLFGFGGMANVNNLGTQPFQDPKLKLNIFDGNNALLWSDSMMYNNPNTPMPGTYYPVQKLGTYTGVYSVSQSVADFNESDNQQSFTYSVDNNIMAKEDIGKMGKGLTAQINNNFSWGNIYHITNSKSSSGDAIICNQVHIGIANANELAQDEASIFVFLYKWNNINGNNIVEENEKITVGFTQYEFATGDPDNEVFSMPMYDFNTFDLGILLESNTTYLLVVQYAVPTINPDLKCYILADTSLDYSLNYIYDSLKVTNEYGNHVLDVGNTGELKLATLNLHAVPVIRLGLSYSSFISGKVFVDENCDNIYNNQDKPIPNRTIYSLDNGWAYGVTDQNGDYIIELNSFGDYSFTAESSPGIIKVPNAHSFSYSTQGETFPNKDFSFCISSSSHELGIDLESFTPPRPGFICDYNICANNLGTNIENAKLEFDYENGIADNYTEIVYSGGGIVNGHTITWYINDIEYFNSKCKSFAVLVDQNTPLGTVFTPHAKITADSGIVELTLSNNEIEFSQTVVGSFDPNDKTVSRQAFSEYDLKNGVDLDYVIRFQNTGNYPASFIEVYDTLQNTLDLKHFSMLSASHPYTLTIIDNILKWRFDNINLPDSTTNEPGSHGYIKFRIKTKENLTKQDVISNTAAIYFDFNAPVFTNTAKTEFVTPTSSINDHKKLDITAFPNPAQNTVKLNFNLTEKQTLNIEILDSAGKLLESNKLNFNSGIQQQEIDLSGFSAGTYLIRVKSDDLSGEVKVIKQ